MKLYFSPGACSLAPHIALREAGLPFDLEQVDLAAKTLKSGGGDYRAINPKGAVPALAIDHDVLTEGAAILQYIADRKPETGLAPAAGTLERYRLAEWLNYIASELHKGFSPLFNQKTPDEYKKMVVENLSTKFDYLSKQLGEKKYLFGDKFSIADGYLFTILNWTRFAKLDMSKWPVLTAYMERVSARPAVVSALKAEGLLRDAA